MKCDSGSTFRTLQPACEKRAPLLLIAVGERSKNSVPLAAAGSRWQPRAFYVNGRQYYLNLRIKF